MKFFKRDYLSETKRRLTANCGCSLDSLIGEAIDVRYRYDFACCEHGAVWEYRYSLDGYHKIWGLLRKRRAKKMLQKFENGPEIYQVFEEKFDKEDADESLGEASQ